MASTIDGQWVLDSRMCGICRWNNGTWMCSLVQPGGHSQTIEKVELLSDVDHIILGPYGFSIERTNDELNEVKLLQSKEWLSLPAE